MKVSDDFGKRMASMAIIIEWTYIYIYIYLYIYIYIYIVREILWKKERNGKILIVFFMTEIVSERPVNYITFFRFLSVAGISLNSDIM